MTWISVKDRLPEEEQRCWFYIPGEPVNEGYYDPEGVYIMFEKRYVPGFRTRQYHLEAYLEVVTHWMPFYAPEPPNEVD